MKIKNLHSVFEESTGVSIDTRTLKAENLFFAIKGPRFDGHNYVDRALESGALYAIIDNVQYENDRTILVDDVQKTLQSLATYHRLKFDIPVLALTGSNGKTTTKELIHSVLSVKFNVLATKGNLNNHLGVPLTLLNLNGDHEVAIVEMGANHLKEIEALSNIALPTMGLITNIGKAHLEGFGGIDGVANGKTELYRYLAKSEGQIFYNPNDPYLIERLPEGINTMKYVENIRVVHSYPKLQMLWDDRQFETGLVGAYNVTNVKAAITVGEFFGLQKGEIIKGIESYESSNNRSEIRRTDKNVLILDAYNANPTSMRASISSFSESEFENKILILGHMLEAGDDSKKEHRELVEYVLKHEWDKVILVGEEFNQIDQLEKLMHFTKVESLIKALENKEVAFLNSTILMKGSRGVSLEKLVPHL